MEIRVRRYSLDQLRRLFDERLLAVPEIQREFVWDARKVCALLDSLYRGYPIGSALVWQTTRMNHTQLREKLHILPAYDPSNREIWFIVDGQQRLSVLYNILGGERRTVRSHRGRTIAFDRFYFYTGSPNDEMEPFVYRQGKPARGYVPVVDVLGDRRHRGLRLGRLATRRADDCRSRLLGATFFLQVMSADRLEDVRETFIRINAQGTPVNSADKAFARASDLQVRHHVRNAIARLHPAGFGELSDEVILSVLAFLLGGGDIAGRAWERMVRQIESGEISRRDFDRAWHALERGLPYAIDYLRSQFGVAHHGLLPSGQLVALLTLYFARRGPKRPSREAAKLLRRWFWLAAVSDRYSGRGYRKHLASDASFMSRLAERGTARLAVDELPPLRDLRHAEYSARSSLSRAYFCLLALQKPRYLEDGSLVPTEAYVSPANRPDRHHIFPRHHLLQHGFGARYYNAIPNVCLLVARENQSIGSKPPRKYLEDVSQSLRARRVALRSHLIPDGPTSAVWAPNTRGSFPAFLDERATVIAKAFEDQAGIRLFRRD